MRVRKPFIAAALVASFLVASCGDDETTSTTGATTTVSEGSDTTAAPDTTVPGDTVAPTTTVYVPPERGDADLVIWADATRIPVLEPVAQAFGEAEGITVSVLEVPSDRIRDNLVTAGPAGQGPDIIVGAHDWLGELVSNGAVAPLDLGTAAGDYADVSVQAFTYEGKTYGLPYAMENIALIRNTDLVPEAPATWEELETIALQLVADGKADVPLAVQQGPADPYHNFPLYSMTGANVFAQNADGTFDPTQLGLDTPEGLASAANFAKWSEEGLISKDVTYDIMIDSFGSGRAPFAITGPWAVNDPDRGFKAMGVNYVVEPIPALAGGATPRVFVGVQGFMISAFSEKQDLAKTFLLDYVNTEDVQLALFDVGGRAPAMTSAYEQVSTDADVLGFGAAATAGQPMPAIPAMSKVWTAWTDAYSLIFTGTDPATAFTDAAAAIRSEIG
ncbi:MAG: maltose ABC transporter substrate-binding protein [Actinomycetota bacterium]|nr:maltose ABC transporter substrate-binding protein [Actinomycetota bacterium]